MGIQTLLKISEYKRNQIDARPRGGNRQTANRFYSSDWFYCLCVEILKPINGGEVYRRGAIQCHIPDCTANRFKS